MQEQEQKENGRAQVFVNCLMTWKRYEKDSSLAIQSLQETSGSAVCQDGNGSGGSLLR
jgi:hypothetical protein